MRYFASLLIRLVLLERALSFSSPAAVQFHHRFLPFPSTASTPEWLPLGSAAVNAEMSAIKLEVPSGHPASSSGGAGGIVDGRGWYQVGVERDGDWVVGSTRACLLGHSAPGVLLHMTDSHLTSLSLQTTSSRCSNSSTHASSIQLPSSNALWDIQIQRPVKISSPSSSTPAPAADPTTGLPIVPPPEKSFLAKWWMPILGLALFLVGQFAAPDAPPTPAK